ncbi:SusC/RagA family TonB-linked outer membrane protein [Ancylomarina longa]|uniref:TonB-dependent receptor n=1 Tax=Ancylomarina longa TaxID=2487017 RepID=A0A434AVC1_9BACT|nr:TonB-dependent receptor [Ancylomarina longa]RUT78297.1 TonB-dependent receptor [Ancylomarina longa]
MRLLFTNLILLLFSLSVFAQNKSVLTGTVTDPTGAPLTGVTVFIKGTTSGTITDIKGIYSLNNVSTENVVVYSFMGYITQELQINDQKIINIQLEEDNLNLDEVVVVGYGKLHVKDLTSSITTVKSEDLLKTPSGQAMQALQGKVAGLQVVSAGAPGESPTIRIRGIGSYPGRGNENPLYVVDGVFFDNIDFLNTADIATISVLKDASAAAIYGVRAANGVVLIETKSGKPNQKAQITYDGYYGYQVAQNVLKMANAEQYTTMALESGSAADASFILNAMQRYGRSRVNPNVPNVNTDWYDEIMRPASIQNHSLSVSGGNDNTSYSLGTSYFAQEGILDMKNEYERFNLRSKIDYKASNKVTVGGNMIFSNATKYAPESGAWNQAYFAVPILPIYDDLNVNATPTNYANAQDLGYRGGQNPFPTLKFNENKQKIRKLLANFYVKLDLIPQKLSFKTTYNHNFTSIDQRNVRLPYFIGNDFQRVDASVVKRAETYSNQTWDNILTYTDSFGDHNVVIMAGSSYRDQAFNMLTATGLNFPTDQEQTYYIEQSETVPSEDVHDDGLRQYGMSYFGRVSYNYKSKYLLYGTMRADGSSKYQQKWGYFPTVGAGWVISEENFLKDVNIIDFLKLRASWGRLGNDKIQASDGAITTQVVTTAINDVLVSGTTTSSTFSSLKWEVTEETNVGLTAKLLNGRLSLDADYFLRDTKNAAINVSIPSVGGSVLKNVGVIRNSGFELALNWNDNISKDFSYSIGANISTLKNEVRNLFGQPHIDGGQAEFRQRSIVGEPLLAFYGREVVGVYQNDAEIQADPVALENGLVPGDLKYKDQNNDGKVDDDDRVVLGSYFPTFMYAFNLGLTYKNWEFSANMLGQTGNKILNRKRGELIWTNDGNLDADLATNRWHGEGTSNKYPSSAGLRKGWNQKMSDYFVEDGSFFRIQNIQLAYNIRKKEWFGFPIPETRISLTADRPLTVFKYNGFNPEVANGVDTQTYPIPAVYTIGLNVKF